MDAFADAMEAKLDANRHKGDREGWSMESPEWLFGRLLVEVSELHAAMIDKSKRWPPENSARGHALAIRSECTDIANFAMMIADVAGGLLPDQPPEPAGSWCWVFDPNGLLVFEVFMPELEPGNPFAGSFVSVDTCPLDLQPGSAIILQVPGDGYFVRRIDHAQTIWRLP